MSLKEDESNNKRWKRRRKQWWNMTFLLVWSNYTDEWKPFEQFCKTIPMNWWCNNCDGPKRDTRKMGYIILNNSAPYFPAAFIRWQVWSSNRYQVYSSLGIYRTSLTSNTASCSFYLSHKGEEDQKWGEWPISELSQAHGEESQSWLYRISYSPIMKVNTIKIKLQNGYFFSR